jgi:hypothetical protein
MKQFRLVDNIMGWMAFAIAAFVYCSTIEPTASFWDCPEFITTGYKLEVGHPPGAPLFMLTANLFSQFTSNPENVARMVNIMNALLSAACILFLFWSITHLVRRLLVDDTPGKQNGEIELPKLIAIEASGLVGALIYTFSDTFWYSAVEGEVYAFSSAFTAVVFWLILKWEEQADKPHSDRWLVLIMYMMGLSIGVHLLNLLCLPAIVLVWYFKRFPHANARGSIVALLVSFVILAVVLYGVKPGVLTVGGWFELFFVNSLHMPFNTGVFVYVIMLLAAVTWAIWETQRDNGNWKRQNIAFLAGFALLGIPFYGYGWGAFFLGVVITAIVGLLLFYRPGGKKGAAPLISTRLKNTAMLSMLMLIIGYSTYAVIVIRSAANPPMAQNSPYDIFNLKTYLDRDQYGNRPLFYGQTFASEAEIDDDGYHYKLEQGAPIYQRKEKANPNEPDEYFVTGNKQDLVYAQNMLFPRMFSNSEPPYGQDHVKFYKTWHGGITGKKVPSIYNPGETITIPTFWDNISFFFSYQCNYMYWRYFLWNFAGRQNDIQGSYGEKDHGNALTGFAFIDNAILGDQSLLPDELKNNKGHNVFYCMPLILGLIGLFWQMLARGRKGLQQFWVVFFLFFMTGLAIVVYLNQTPLQPRERDYAYAGSFYAYAIWCGMGVAAIYSWLAKFMKASKTTHIAVAAGVAVIGLLVPIQMASQTWDDHDRSDRYTCRDFGQNYLMTLQEKGNPIIFTNGDNDTFPLWYNQDCEGVRTDARVCNLSYLATDWYIKQMIQPAYDSPSLPIKWNSLQYVTGTNDRIQVDPYVCQAIKFIQKNYPEEASKLFGDDPFELKNVLKYWVRNERSNEQIEEQKEVLKWVINNGMQPGDRYNLDERLHVIPTDTVYLNIDKEAVKRSGMYLQGDSIPDRMAIALGGYALDKSKLMMLEMLANANWERPMYVAMTVGQDNYMSLGNHFIQEGLAYRITPFNTRAAGMTDFDTEKTYTNVMTKFKFGGVKTPGIYLDETVMRMCHTHRMLMVDLAYNLYLNEKKDSAMKVLDKMETELPAVNVPHTMDGRIVDGKYLGYKDGKGAVYVSSFSTKAVRLYYEMNKLDKARAILDALWKYSSQYARYYMSFNGANFNGMKEECLTKFAFMERIIYLYYAIDEKKGSTMRNELETLARQFVNKGGDIDAVHWHLHTQMPIPEDSW